MDGNEIFLQETAHLLFGSILLQEGAATDSIILVEKGRHCSKNSGGKGPPLCSGNPMGNSRLW